MSEYTERSLREKISINIIQVGLLLAFFTQKQTVLASLSELKENIFRLRVIESDIESVCLEPSLISIRECVVTVGRIGNTRGEFDAKHMDKANNL